MYVLDMKMAAGLLTYSPECCQMNCSGGLVVCPCANNDLEVLKDRYGNWRDIWCPACNLIDRIEFCGNDCNKVTQ